MARVITQPTALDRAKRVWGEEAALIRGELRERGVRGRLRRLDERASGTRGRAAALSTFADAVELARNGLPLEVALAHSQRVLEQTYRLAYEQAANDGRGGPLSAA